MAQGTPVSRYLGRLVEAELERRKPRPVRRVSGVAGEIQDGLAALREDNARERVVRPVVKRADELLAERGQPQLPRGVTAHKLRHTFASILYVRGEDPPTVMAQLGHTDAAFTLRVYAHAMRRDAGDNGPPQGARRRP